MKSSTRLNSAVFHLTPTRTRCDLIINANGKTEKIASGLLNPFLAHLKTAQDQISQGGYSIRLEPEPRNDATWFTKGTVERFVRFVSTPEVLERVYTIEFEIFQIEEAIAIQGNNVGLSTVEDRQAKPVERIEGKKPMPDTNEEKAIVPYKPGADLPEANRTTGREENSKVQLLRVLETRKTVLQKEQGMAFARAVAAGFDIDHMKPLLSFSECFGASRLMDACSRFNDLWNRKHETGQWLELEAAEATSNRLEFSSMNASGILLSNVASKQKDNREGWPDSCGEMLLENNGKADQKHPMDHQVPLGHQEYFQGHFPHHMYPPWPVHSQPGAVPVFQPYPMQGMPYYQNFPGNSPFIQPPHPSAEESRSNAGQRISQKRHSMDSKGSITESESWDMDASRTRSQDDSEIVKETSLSRESQKRASRSSKKSGMVVIRNINYITSKRQNSSDSESQSATDSGTDEDPGDLHADAPEVKHKNSMGSTKRIGNHTKCVDTLNTVNDTFDEMEADGGHWQAFQNCILRGADEDKLAVDRGMFAMERDIKAKKRQSRVGEDPVVFGGRDPVQMGEGITDFHKINGDVAHIPKASNDQLLISRREGHYEAGFGYRVPQMDAQFTEAGGSRVGTRRTGNDDFVIHGRENQSNSTRSLSDPLAVNGYDGATNKLDKSTSHNLADESFIVLSRSILQNQDGTDDRNALDMDSELPSTLQKAEDIKTGSHVNYEPDDLGLMPERGIEKGSIGFDPALDYDMQAHANNATSVNDRNNMVMTEGKKGLKKSDKDRRPKVHVDTLEKKMAATRQGKPSKSSPLEEARARAERLRSFKADLQKVKKEKEEEQIKRLEALKIERQKRIAARNGPIPIQSPLPSQQAKRQLPTKLSPSSHKVSKFNDSEPGPLSPVQGFPIRTPSLGSSDLQKPSKPRSGSGSNSVGNRLSRSVSSLPESKKERNGVKPESKASMVKNKRLSEPRMSSSHHSSSVKLQNTESVSKLKITDGSESKKISAIINLDRTKAATLPELKIRTSKGPSNVVHNKSAAKETTHKGDGNDNPVIEKTFVMLECEKPSSPVGKPSEGKMGDSLIMDNHKRGESAEAVSEYVAIHAPASPLTLDAVDRELIGCHLQVQPSYKVTTISAEDSLKFPSIDEKTYKAPYARVSSLEDPCTGNLEYGKAPPTSLEMVTTEAEFVRARVTDYNNLKLEKIPEALEKPHAKESSKGIRRLLKFGRKNHSSAEHNVEPDNAIFSGSGVNNSASSSEVHTLKNLISRDETPTTNTTPQKSSRHFSLLLPFRSKTGEKKLTT